jgi:hypothetical protein
MKTKRKYVRKIDFHVRLVDGPASNGLSIEEYLTGESLRTPAPEGSHLLWVLEPHRFHNLLKETGSERYRTIGDQRFLEMQVGGHPVFVANAASLTLKL